MKKTAKTQAQQEPAPKLADFRDGFKDEKGKREEEALPPTEGQEPSRKIFATTETEDLVYSKVRNATYVMEQVFNGAFEIMKVKLEGSVLDMQPGVPPNVVSQLALPLAQVMFREVYTTELDEKLKFEYAEVPKNE